MSISNTLSRGDRVLVLESGRFAVVWGEMAAVSRCPDRDRPSRPIGHRSTRPTSRNACAPTPTGAIKAVFAVHVDTSTSVRNDIAAIRRAIDAADHPALLMVDCIASLGCDRFLMDEWGVDVTVAASQKGLMVPPGLGFVWAGPQGVGSARARRVAIRLLGLDAPLAGRSALPALLRHAARAPHVRPPRGPGDDPRGDARRGGIATPRSPGRCTPRSTRGRRPTGSSCTSSIPTPADAVTTIRTGGIDGSALPRPVRGTRRAHARHRLGDRTSTCRSASVTWAT